MKKKTPNKPASTIIRDGVMERPKTRKILIEVVTHYAKKDKRFNQDYLDIEVFINGKLTVTYGNERHFAYEVGFIEGFIHGTNLANGDEVEIKKTNKADRDIDDD